jgi:hypothetical protein
MYMRRLRAGTILLSQTGVSCIKTGHVTRLRLVCTSSLTLRTVASAGAGTLYAAGACASLDDNRQGPR